jgi:hypothetical protein
LLELQKQSKWLGSRGDIQTRRNNFEKVVHTSPWRFYPKGSGRSTGTTYTTSESLVEDYLERKHRRKKPRTLRPIPSQVRGYGFQTSSVDVRPRYVNNASLKTNQLFGEVTECGAPGINNNNATFVKQSAGLRLSDVYGTLGTSSPYAQSEQQQARSLRQSTINDALISQVKRYKTENESLRKHKRATLYILRLLEQKVLELSGKKTVVDPISPDLSYEMHPEVYSILKENHRHIHKFEKKQVAGIIPEGWFSGGLPVHSRGRLRLRADHGRC